GRELDQVAVHGRAELHAVLVDLAQLLEAEDLKTARVGQDRAAPVHEAVQAAVSAHDVGPRAQHEVEGVAEHDVGAEVLELLGRHGLDAAVSADGHEGRRLYRAARECQAAAPRGAVLTEHGEAHQDVRRGAGARAPSPVPPPAPGAGVTNI